jgi:hypothetical protein
MKVLLKRGTSVAPLSVLLTSQPSILVSESQTDTGVNK